MYYNVSKKIKRIANVFTALGALISFILSFLVSCWTDFKLYLILITLGGSLLSWLISLCLYGFGQLIENSDKTVSLLEDINNKTNHKQ